LKVNLKSIYGPKRDNYVDKYNRKTRASALVTARSIRERWMDPFGISLTVLSHHAQVYMWGLSKYILELSV
jgi:hypothetical protein